MFNNNRRISLTRAAAMIGEQKPEVALDAEAFAHLRASDACSFFEHKLRQADLNLGVKAFSLLVLFSAVTLAVVSARLLDPYFVPLFALAGGWLPLSWLGTRITKRANSFAEDYSATLLATASSLKAGLTPYLALERSSRLLQENSLVKREVIQLLEALRRGETKEVAVSRFGLTIALEDLALFRSAFLLLLENGGRFAPTLMRLSQVSRDRLALIRSAHVSTANMRMTANILLVLAPLLVLMTAVRTPDYWTLFLTHPTAHFLASLGLVVILLSFGLLRLMSAFRP